MRTTQASPPASEPPAPPAGTALTWRGLSNDDLEAVFTLISRIQAHDQVVDRTTLSDLRTLAGQSWVDLGADALVGLDNHGEPRAVGRNAFRPGSVAEHIVELTGGVDPEWRGQGIGRALLAWQRARGEQNVAAMRAESPAAATLPALIGCAVEEQVTDDVRLLERAGFVPARWFKQMRRSLSRAGEAGPAPERELPPGLRLEPYAPALAEPLRLAHNDAFRDHWGSTPHTPEAWRTELLESESFRPALSYVILDSQAPDDPVVAYVGNAEHAEQWDAQGFTEGYTDIIGVRRTWRGHGLARLLLQVSAAAFAAQGHAYAALDVDADNPTGAFGLYESLGYEPVLTETFYAVTA